MKIKFLKNTVILGVEHKKGEEIGLDSLSEVKEDEDLVELCIGKGCCFTLRLNKQIKLIKN